MSTSRMHVYIPLVRKFASRLTFFHTAVATELGLNATDVHCLRLLESEPMSAGKLSNEIGLTGAAVTALIDRLETAGFVARERGANDRRRITVRANGDKLREVEALYAGQGAEMKKLLAQYSADEFRVIADFLERTTQVLIEETKALKERS